MGNGEFSEIHFRNMLQEPFEIRTCFLPFQCFDYLLRSGPCLVPQSHWNLKNLSPPEQKHASSQKHRYSRTHWHAPRALFPRSVRFIDNTRPPAHTLSLIAAKWAWAWYLHIARVWSGAYILFTAWECRLHNLPIYVNCRRPQAPPFPLAPFKLPTSCSIQLQIMHMLMGSI